MNVFLVFQASTLEIVIEGISIPTVTKNLTCSQLSTVQVRTPYRLSNSFP